MESPTSMFTSPATAASVALRVGAPIALLVMSNSVLSALNKTMGGPQQISHDACVKSNGIAQSVDLWQQAARWHVSFSGSSQLALEQHPARLLPARWSSAAADVRSDRHPNRPAQQPSEVCARQCAMPSTEHRIVVASWLCFTSSVRADDVLLVGASDNVWLRYWQ